MNSTALSKIKECLSLASEFVKDENSYSTGEYITSSCCSSISSGCFEQVKINKISNDIRAKAELEASRLEKQEKCAKLITECLEYLKTVEKFENQVEICKCKVNE